MSSDPFIDPLLEMNPWLSVPQQFSRAVAQRHLPAAMVSRATQLIADFDHATLIIGPRQAGKSTLELLAQ